MASTLPDVEKQPVRQVLADNLKTLMKATPALDSQPKLAAKAGIAQTSISQMLRPDNDAMKSPKLTQVEKVATAFGLATWQLLLDPNMVGDQMASMLMRPAPSDERVRNEYVNNDARAKRKGAKA